MNLKMNDIIVYDNGIMKGTGMVVGCASVEMPILGKMYIINDLSQNIPNETYDYDTFVCAECHVTKQK